MVVSNSLSPFPRGKLKLTCQFQEGRWIVDLSRATVPCAVHSWGLLHGSHHSQDFWKVLSTHRFFQGQLARLFPSLLCFSWAGTAYWRELRETEAEEHWHKSYQNTLSTLYFLKVPNSESTSLSKCQFCLLLSLPTGRGPGLLVPTRQIH